MAITHPEHSTVDLDEPEDRDTGPTPGNAAPSSDVGLRVRNIRTTFSNPRARLNLLITLVVLMLMVVYGLHTYLGSRAPAATTPPAGASNLSAPTASQAPPGTSQNPGYNRLVEQANANQAAAAVRQGDTTLPILVNPATTGSTPSLPPAPATTAVTPSSTPPAVVPGEAVTLPANDTGPESQTSRAMDQDVGKQMAMYLKIWSPHAAYVEFDALGQKPKPAAAASTAAAATSTTPSTSAAARARFVTAGQILPGVLLSPINSDHPGPVLAEIVGGPLSGAKLLGGFQDENDRVVIHFTTLSMPARGTSYQISAFAVNPNTASTALASNVNHHYLERYGLLLASAFVAGYGQAAEQQATVTTLTPLGGVVSTSGAMTNRQIALGALGNVGATLGGSIASNVSGIKPTVTVNGPHGAPMAIGVLFVSNF